MYATHQPAIARWAAQSPANLLRTAIFVQNTINQQFPNMPAAMADFDAYGRDSKFFSVYKRRAYDALLDETPLWSRRLRTWQHAPEKYTEPLIRRICELPNFGIVKAGFLTQLLLGTGGCLDRHLLRYAGLRENAFATNSRLRAEGLTQKIRTYLSTCQNLGGSALLWDWWCSNAVVQFPAHFRSAEEVSALHVSLICGD